MLTGGSGEPMATGRGERKGEGSVCFPWFPLYEIWRKKKKKRKKRKDRQLWREMSKKMYFDGYPSGERERKERE